jgi:hypothetical protein
MLYLMLVGLTRWLALLARHAASKDADPGRYPRTATPPARARKTQTAARYDYQANITAFLTRHAPWATAAGQST